MMHVDITKFANIPDGGGHRFVGRQQGGKNQRATPGLTRGADYKPRTGVAYLHTVIDDHSRLAYVEICSDEKATTAAAVLRRAVAWYDERGVDTERVLSDKGSCYRSNLWRDTCAELGITHKRTRPYRPQTNSKIERFTAPSPTAGPTPTTTPQTPNDEQPYRVGSTFTITTASTPRTSQLVAPAEGHSCSPPARSTSRAGRAYAGGST